MKREIKFRGFQKSWIFGGVTIFEGQANIFDKNCVANTSYEVDLNSVGQYTGLKDKNGEEIYEGDIVRWDDMSGGQSWRVAVVELFPALQFRIIRINRDFIQSAQEGKIFEFGNFAYTDTHNHLEVIGNIHENSELLNK